MAKNLSTGHIPLRSVIFVKVFFTILFCVSVVPAAHAYLDPGTGSFILQTLIAALFGAIFVLKSYWVRIKSWFYGSNNASEGSEAESVSKKTTDGDSLAQPKPSEDSSSMSVEVEARKKSDAKSDEQ